MPYCMFPSLCWFLINCPGSKVTSYWSVVSWWSLSKKKKIKNKKVFRCNYRCANWTLWLSRSQITLQQENSFVMFHLKKWKNEVGSDKKLKNTKTLTKVYLKQFFTEISFLVSRATCAILFGTYEVEQGPEGECLGFSVGFYFGKTLCCACHFIGG